MGRKTVAYSYVRFSTPDQSKGFSLKRQLEKAQEFAEKQEWILDESLNLRDLGISAFKGQNVDKGALGEFLKLIESGKIARGSVLLVENLDRLTRSQPTYALNLFLQIIQAGVTIATAMDETIYNEEILNSSMGTGRLFQSILILTRGNEESKTKSKRLLNVWENKRENLFERKATARGPAWLVLNREKNRFDEIKDRATIIKKIFDSYLAGKGAEAITRDLNNREVPTWGRSAHWHKSYVQKILKNRAALGEFQAHHKVDGKRQPIGSPVADYYPRVITKNKFHRAQAMMKAKGPHAGGRNGKVSNLFGHLAYCHKCRRPMSFVNKGRLPRGGQYLVCDKARLGGKCDYVSIQYPMFEKALLTYCADLSVGDLLNNSTDSKAIQIELLNDLISSITNQYDETKNKIKNLISSLEGESNKDFQILVKKQIQNRIDQQKELAAKLKNLESEKDVLLRSAETAEHRLKGVQDLIEKMKDESGNFDMRLNLRARMRALIQKILVQGNKKTDLAEKTFNCTIYFKDRSKLQTIKFDKKGNTTAVRTINRPRGLDDKEKPPVEDGSVDPGEIVLPEWVEKQIENIRKRKTKRSA